MNDTCNSKNDIIMLERYCPICNTNNNTELFAASTFDQDKLNSFSFSSRKTPEDMHLELRSCRECSLIYASKVPDTNSLHVLYKNASFDRSIESTYAARTYIKLFKKYVLSQFDSDVSKLSLLDIGAGDGAFLEEVFKLGVGKICGLEPSEAPLNIASPLIKEKIIQDSFHPSQFPDNSFDIITCFQTIEHLSDPLLVSKTVYSALKPGGLLFIICHNTTSVSAKVLKMKSPIFDIEHLQLFCPTSAKNLLKKANFRNCISRPILNQYPLSYWINLLPLNQKLKNFVNKISLFLKINTIPIPMMAGNILVIGTKEKGN